MNVAVTLFYHDYEPSLIFVDTNLFDESNYVDQQLSEAIQEPDEEWCLIEAMDWESDERFSNEPELSDDCVLEEKPETFEEAIFLKIVFE